MSIHNLPSPARGGGQGGGRTLIPMARPQIGPYGSWRSPVTADAIVSGVIGLSQIQLDGDDIYWVEGRPAEAGRNVIVRRRPDGSTTGITPARTLVQANDFYSSPRVSPSGTHLSWLTWNHPNMPWDGTELWEAELTADGVRALRKVAGAEGESIFQPSWSPDGVLYFVSDRSNW